MRNRFPYGVALALLFEYACGFAVASEDGIVRVQMQTDLGKIELEINLEHAPISAGNFLRYVDEGRFKGAHFYRVVRMDNQPNSQVKIEVIQGGLGFREDPQRLPEIAHETTGQTGLKHLDGTLSMARAAPGTASSEFFICVGDQPELDFGGKRNPDGRGFATFGRVVDGMDTVRMIQRGEDDGQMLKETVAITRIERIDKRSGSMDLETATLGA